MEINTFAMREIKADKDKVLTNGKTFFSVGGSVYLGKNDSLENWYEITQEEYEAIIAEQEKSDDEAI